MKIEISGFLITFQCVCGVIVVLLYLLRMLAFYHSQTGKCFCKKRRFLYAQGYSSFYYIETQIKGGSGAQSNTQGEKTLPGKVTI